MEAPNVLTRATSPSRIALSTIVTTPMECDYDVRPTMLYKVRPENCIATEGQLASTSSNILIIRFLFVAVHSK
jgi:hypothetical protein